MAEDFILINIVYSGNVQSYYVRLTRSAAVERFAKSICKNIFKVSWECVSEQEKKRALSCAEAALDALIGDKK